METYRRENQKSTAQVGFEPTSPGLPVWCKKNVCSNEINHASEYSSVVLEIKYYLCGDSHISLSQGWRIVLLDDNSFVSFPKKKKKNIHLKKKTISSHYLLLGKKLNKFWIFSGLQKISECFNRKEKVHSQF